MNHVVMSVIYVWLTLLLVNYVVDSIALRTLAGTAPRLNAGRPAMLAELLETMGIATAFAFIFLMGDRVTAPNWSFYGLLWWYMAATAQIARVMSGAQAWRQAMINSTSALIAFLLAAYAMMWLIKP